MKSPAAASTNGMRRAASSSRTRPASARVTLGAAPRARAPSRQRLKRPAAGRGRGQCHKRPRAFGGARRGTALAGRLSSSRGGVHDALRRGDVEWGGTSARGMRGRGGCLSVREGRVGQQGLRHPRLETRHMQEGAGRGRKDLSRKEHEGAERSRKDLIIMEQEGGGRILVEGAGTEQEGSQWERSARSRSGPYLERVESVGRGLLRVEQRPERRADPRVLPAAAPAGQRAPRGVDSLSSERKAS